MNLGIIGSGYIVSVLLDTLVNVSEIKIPSICVRNSSLHKGRALAEKYNIKNIYTSLDEFLNSTEIDTVYIGIVNSLHYEYAKLALESGENVICEKPFTQTTAEAEDLFDMAEKNGVYLFEAITTIHMPMFKKAKENLDKIGQVRIINCSFCQYSSRYDKYLNGDYAPVFKKELFGGTLVDLNIYNIHFVASIFGEPKAIYYYPNIGKNGVDTSGVLIMDYGDFKAVCVGAKDSASDSFGVIQGEKGYIKIGSTLNSCENCTVNTKDSKDFYLPPEDFDRMYYEMKEFDRIIKDKDVKAYKSLCDESKLVMKILEKAYSVMK